MSEHEPLLSALDKLREKRGYLLAHHGLLTLLGSDVIDAYDTLYSTVTLRDNVLSAYEKEFVWLGLLIARREQLAVHHVQKFLDAGGSEDDVTTILALTACATGAGHYAFVATTWSSLLPDFDADHRYLAAFESAAAGKTQNAHLLAIGVHTMLGHQAPLAIHIEAAYQHGLAEIKIAEAMSIAMLPGGVPALANAAETWRALIAAGTVKASDAFVHWASVSGQDGFQA